MAHTQYFCFTALHSSSLSYIPVAFMSSIDFQFNKIKYNSHFEHQKSHVSIQFAGHTFLCVNPTNPISNWCTLNWRQWWSIILKGRKINRNETWFSTYLSGWAKEQGGKRKSKKRKKRKNLKRWCGVYRIDRVPLWSMLLWPKFILNTMILCVCDICQRSDGEPHNEHENRYLLMNAECAPCRHQSANPIIWDNEEYVVDSGVTISVRLRSSIALASCHSEKIVDFETSESKRRNPPSVPDLAQTHSLIWWIQCRRRFEHR